MQYVSGHQQCEGWEDKTGNIKKKKVQATVASIRWQIQYRVDLKGWPSLVAAAAVDEKNLIPEQI